MTTFKIERKKLPHCENLLLKMVYIYVKLRLMGENMEVKKMADMLINDCRRKQRDLYHQIERIEYSINLLDEKRLTFLIRPRMKNKITYLIDRLKTHKRLLEGHANFIDIKLSVLTKEALNPHTTIERLQKIKKYSYGAEKIIKLPQEVVDGLLKFGIKFDEQDDVCMSLDPNDNLENDS